MDQFTAGLLLDVATIDSDKAADLYKELKVVEGGPSKEAIEWFAKHMGCEVSIKGTDMIGYVSTLNRSTSGFYPGSRYPIYVRITKDERTEYNAAGQAFEYDIDQLEIISAKEEE